MPRPRKNNPLAGTLHPLAQRFSHEVAQAVMGYVEEQVRVRVQSVLDKAVGRSSHAGVPAAPKTERKTERKVRLCRVVECGQPSKGPRYDFFCEVHRNLPQAEKDAIKGTSSAAAPVKARPAKAAKARKRAAKK